MSANYDNNTLHMSFGDDNQNDKKSKKGKNKVIIVILVILLILSIMILEFFSLLEFLIKYISNSLIESDSINS